MWGPLRQGSTSSWSFDRALVVILSAIGAFGTERERELIRRRVTSAMPERGSFDPRRPDYNSLCRGFRDSGHRSAEPHCRTRLGACSMLRRSLWWTLVAVCWRLLFSLLYGCKFLQLFLGKNCSNLWRPYLSDLRRLLLLLIHTQRSVVAQGIHLFPFVVYDRGDFLLLIWGKLKLVIN